MGVEQASSLSDDIATQVSQPLLISTRMHVRTHAQVAHKGEYSPLTNTCQKVDAVSKDEVVQVSSDNVLLFLSIIFVTVSFLVCQECVCNPPDIRCPRQPLGHTPNAAAARGRVPQMNSDPTANRTLGRHTLPIIVLAFCM